MIILCMDIKVVIKLYLKMSIEEIITTTCNNIIHINNTETIRIIIRINMYLHIQEIGKHITTIITITMDRTIKIINSMDTTRIENNITITTMEMCMDSRITILIINSCSTAITRITKIVIVHWILLTEIIMESNNLTNSKKYQIKLQFNIILIITTLILLLLQLFLLPWYLMI